jgi:hypothetical protein
MAQPRVAAKEPRMADRTNIRDIIDAAVSQVLDGHIPQLREDLARSVFERVQPQLESSDTAGSRGDAHGLLQCLSAIHAGTNQKEVLRALLDTTEAYSGRSALFVVRAGAATGWEARGFSNSGDIKDIPLDVGTGPAAQALQSHSASAGKVSDVDTRFLSQFGAPSHDQVVFIPLLLKDKAAALLYADGGDNKAFDPAALELLVKATGAWLEVALLRKQTAKEGATEAAEPPRAPSVPVSTVSSFSDPFAGHTPIHTAKPEIPAEELAPSPAAAPAAVAEPEAAAEMSAEDADMHRKALRFARLLVDEIKLYNQAKVAEGRKNRDLYDRLKEDIEKSRSTYQRRYGKTAAASGDYFNGELVRSLAEDDIAIMGTSFRR